MNPNVTAVRFLEVFSKVWRGALCVELTSRYQSSRAWTETFLAEKSGLISMVLNELCDVSDKDSVVRAQWYTLDALLVSGRAWNEEHAEPGRASYPSKLDVLVEHENGEKLEEEMWKLIFWRSPLKVLIGYDWPESEKARSETRQAWLTRKVQALQEMLDTANDRFPESELTEYLLLVGQKNEANEIRWKWARLDKLGRTGLADLV